MLTFEHLLRDPITALIHFATAIFNCKFKNFDVSPRISYEAKRFKYSINIEMFDQDIFSFFLTLPWKKKIRLEEEW